MCTRGVSVRRIFEDQEGSALLEGAIVVPFLFALVFGTLEFSYYFYQQHLVSTGVRDAARYLARVENPADAAAQALAQNLAATGSPMGGAARRVRGFDPGEVAITVTPVANVANGICGADPCRGPNPLQRINVTGSFAWVPLGFWGFFGFGGKNVTVMHSERWIGRS